MTIRSPRPAAETARDIVTDPTAFADQPAILAAAWDALKAARGQTVRHDRLARPAHLVDRTDACDGLDDMAANRALRIRAAIDARAAHTGTTRPAPLILRDALPTVADRAPVGR